MQALGMEQKAYKLDEAAEEVDLAMSALKPHIISVSAAVSIWVP